MNRRMRVGVIYGGRSGEHEVSLRSASSVIAALDPERYEVVPIAITKAGRWLSGPDSLAQLEEAQRTMSAAPDRGREVTIAPDPTRRALLPLAGPAGREAPRPLDVVFPVLHGTYGEDGTIQGLLELADLPYVGAGVLASATGMDKAAMKSLFRDAGLPLCRWIVAQTAVETPEAIARRAAETLGFPCFVKPANLGSSVGISKVNDSAALTAAIGEAAAYDPKIVIEEGVDAREFECGVLGNERAEASVVGELVPSREFYDYADKYVEQGARIVIPAELPAETAAEMRALAIRAFQAIDCSGLARVDFFLDRRSGRVLLNEINTMPGFTSISMFPKLWAATGIEYPALVDRLIQLALERHAARTKRRLSFTPPEAAPGTKKRARR
jgi:D-alanine-D-alanine ligase